jgi:hypothetical protein
MERPYLKQKLTDGAAAVKVSELAEADRFTVCFTVCAAGGCWLFVVYVCLGLSPFVSTLICVTVATATAGAIAQGLNSIAVHLMLTDAFLMKIAPSGVPFGAAVCLFCDLSPVYPISICYKPVTAAVQHTIGLLLNTCASAALIYLRCNHYRSTPLWYALSCFFVGVLRLVTFLSPWLGDIVTF